MSGNWQRAWYPPEGRERQGRRGGRLGKVEEVVGARMREFTTVGIGGPAERIVFSHSVKEGQEVLAAERGANREVRALGAGSNLLVSDGGIRGTVICLKKNMGKVLFAPEGAVVADAGVLLPRFAVLCALSSLSGAEELGGIPGTVGGALTMNAGAYGRSVGEIVEWVEIADDGGNLPRGAAGGGGFSSRGGGRPPPGG